MSAAGNLKSWLRGHLTASRALALKYQYARAIHGEDLARLARRFGTDKEGAHFYCQHYQRHFEALRQKPINLLEIGIGGWDDSTKGGESLRMWKAYFPHGRINGIDVVDKRGIEEARIRTFAGSQVDEEFLKAVIAEIGTPDIIIDDGSHMPEHVIHSFHLLFPLLAPNGIYVVEALQTSYWGPDSRITGNYGGSSDLSAPHTSMNFLKSLADCLNYEEFPLDRYEPSYFDRNIVGVSFYHNLAFIQKGTNDEGSNMLGKR